MTKEEFFNEFKGYKIDIMKWTPQPTSNVFYIKIQIKDDFDLFVYGDTNEVCKIKIIAALDFLKSLSPKEFYLSKLFLHKNNVYANEVSYLYHIKNLTNEQVDKLIDIFEWCDRYLQRINFTGDKLQEDYLLDYIANYTFEDDNCIANIDLYLDITKPDETIEQFNILKPFMQNLIFINTLRGNNHD